MRESCRWTNRNLEWCPMKALESRSFFTNEVTTFGRCDHPSAHFDSRRHHKLDRPRRYLIMATTYQIPANLGDILGAHHDGNFNTQVSEIKAGIGVLLRGTILATGTAGDIGKLVKLTAGTEASSYGILLDPSVDTSIAFGDGSVTGSIAKSGTFKGSALLVPTGVDAGLIAVALRGRGIFVEGPITVPAALAARESEAEKAEEKEERPYVASAATAAAAAKRH